MLLTVEELRGYRERYRGYLLARRHKAKHAMTEIQDSYSCYEEILGAALDEIGERRLVAALAKPVYAKWAGELLQSRELRGRLSSRSRGALVRCMRNMKAVVALTDTVMAANLAHRQRKPLMRRIAKLPSEAGYLLGRNAVGHLYPPLSQRERALLRANVE